MKNYAVWSSNENLGSKDEREMKGGRVIFVE
jgi:hypothetical protein